MLLLLITFRLLLHFFQLPECFDISAVFHLLTELRTVTTDHSVFSTTLYVMLLEGLTGQAHSSLMWVSDDKMYVILLYSNVQLVFCPIPFLPHPHMMVDAYTF